MNEFCLEIHISSLWNPVLHNDLHVQVLLLCRVLVEQTREEKKLEAILKTIEKMEKREERKKEALARLEHSKKQQNKEKDVKANDGDAAVANVAETVVDKEQKLTTEVSLAVKLCV